jgi:alkylation response protein AidB-like acyl-CoA dehydrogenase
METLSEGRVGVAANMVGVAQAVYEYALQYAKERIQFGQPIGRFQPISHKVDGHEHHGCPAHGPLGRPSRGPSKGLYIRSSACKLFAPETAVKVARKAVQICGG